jgi:hypothetical protein
MNGTNCLVSTNSMCRDVSILDLLVDSQLLFTALFPLYRVLAFPPPVTAHIARNK